MPFYSEEEHIKDHLSAAGQWIKSAGKKIIMTVS